MTQRLVATGILTVAGLFAAVLPRPAQSQSITVDGSLAPARTLAGPNYTIGADLGKQVGGNLFHSFGQFGLATGESATFTGPATVANIIGRVTGGSPSAIDGTIQSNIAGANLYLINPSGIVFGANAKVNVSGSFAASTGDYLKLKDGTRFQASNPGISSFGAAPPAAFGFLTATPAAITVNGSNLGPVPGRLGLAGGAVSITGGSLTAPSGTIALTGVAGAGEVPLNPRNKAGLTVSKLGPVQIGGGALVDVSNSNGTASNGSVFVRAGRLTVDDSGIDANNYGSGAGGNVRLRGDRGIALTGGSFVGASSVAGGRGGSVFLTAGPAAILIDASSIIMDSLTTGAAGDLKITAKALTMADGGSITSDVFGAGAGGNITVGVRRRFVVDGAADNFTGIEARVRADATGNAGTVSVAAGSLAVVDDGQIVDNTFSSGNGGDVHIVVRHHLGVDGGGTAEFTGIAASASTGGTGDAGNLTIAAGSLSLVDNGEIFSSTFSAGAGGNVDVAVQHRLRIDGAGTSVFTGVAAATNPGSSGNAGTATISAGSLLITDNGEILSSAFATGNAGNINVTVRHRLKIDGAGETALTGLSAATFSGSGNAGDIIIHAGSLALEADGEISSSTFADGAAGTIRVRTGALSIADGGLITSSTEAAGNAGAVAVAVRGRLTIDGVSGDSGVTTGITSQADLGSTGAAGTVSVHAGSVAIDSVAEISSNTFGDGAAGTVTLHAGTLSIADNAFVSSDTSAAGNAGGVSVFVHRQLTVDGSSGDDSLLTGIASQTNPGSTGNAGTVNVRAGSVALSDSSITSSTLGDGAAGIVTVHAGTLSIEDGGIISSSTSGSGNAGGVAVSVRGRLTIDATAAAPSLVTGISSQANRSSSGNAGTVSVRAGSLVIEDGGVVSSNTFADGAAGRVTVRAGALSIDADGGISSDTSGSGAGGVVVVRAGTLSITDNGYLTSDTSAAGTAGGVVIAVRGRLTIDAASSDAGSLTGIASQADRGSTGDAGMVRVHAGSLAIIANGGISSSTFASGAAGGVVVAVRGQLTLDGLSGNPHFSTGITSQANPRSSGDAGTVTVRAGSMFVLANGQISSGAFGPGEGGDVDVGVRGRLTISGAGGNTSTFTGIGSEANPRSSGNAGTVSVRSGSLAVRDSGAISSSTFAMGNGGGVTVNVTDAVTVAGDGEISASAFAGSHGNAGSVTLVAGGPVALARGGQISSTTAGQGTGGTVTVTAAGALSLTGAGTGITSSAAAHASGNAGSVAVDAPQVTVASGARIASTMAGTAKGGSVTVTAAGAVTLDGKGSRIAASATGARSLQGGSVTIAAGSLAVQRGARVASATHGIGSGGAVEIVASDIDLTGAGSQITALSTGNGDAGSIGILASRLQIADAAAVSTASTGGSGGDITLAVGDLLYLQHGSVTTASGSLSREGNGGNITIDPRFVVLADHSVINANAFGGNGGNISIVAGQFLASTDSIVEASSQLGVSGTITIAAPQVALNGGLVALASDLRAAAVVLREACADQSRHKRSRLIAGSRGGQVQDPDASLSALYLAGRDAVPPAAAARPQASLADLAAGGSSAGCR